MLKPKKRKRRDKNNQRKEKVLLILFKMAQLSMIYLKRRIALKKEQRKRVTKPKRKKYNKP